MDVSRIAIATLCFGLLGTLPALADTKVTMQEGSEVVGDAGDMPEGMRQAYAGREPTTVVCWLAEDRSECVAESGSMIRRFDAVVESIELD